MLHRNTAIISKEENGIAEMDNCDRKLEKSENSDDKKKSINGCISPTTSTIGPKRKFRIIDETQLSEEEARKLELRRAYNRDCASRARTRTKSLVQELQEQVSSLKQEKEELRQSNTNLQACLAFSEKQNRELIAKHSLTEARSFHSSAFGARDLPLLHTTSLQGMGLHSNNVTAVSRLMYDAEQSQQLNLLQQSLLLQQQQNAASAVSAANSSKMFPAQSSAFNNIVLSHDQLNIRDQFMNMNSAPNRDLLAALVRMRQDNNNAS